ncbi:MAG: YqgE/AlgH family protein [Gammaproteobacteria bacterium]
MVETSYLTNHFLIAMPTLEDPNFARTVTYICEHNEEGAMGIVINRPLDLHLGDVLSHMDLKPKGEQVAQQSVLLGGPVQRERGFVLHSPASDWDATLRINERIGVTTSRDILAAIAEGEGPEHALVALGYAGWAPGQLEQEMADNAWLSGPADYEILFELPFHARWEAAALSLGVDLHTLSDEVGHA